MLKGNQWRGKQCSMQCYFYGVKVQVLTTTSGIPVEFCFGPGSESDVQALKKLPMTVAAESNIYADSAYTDYTIEDDMKDAEFINLLVQRKSNAKHKDEPWIRSLKEHIRERNRDNFFNVERIVSQKIHAVTFKGFLLKLIMFIEGFTFDKLV